MSSITFSIQHKSTTTKARRGVLHTPHGDIQTPAFVAVGTKGTVKGLTVPMLREVGLQTLIANTYHLHLQPSSDTVANMGGLHNFMQWDGPLLTDSGGFQVFSLGAAYGADKSVSKISREDLDASTTQATVFDVDVATQHGKLAQIDEEGVSFTSHIDGSLHRFTPERSVEIQHQLGADIFFAFDECTGAEASHAYQQEAMFRTHRWAERSLRAHRQNIDAQKKQGIFGIVQGGRFEDLRKESARVLAEMDFDGYGIGGSYQKADIDTAVGWVTDILPEEKPRHLLGIGEPEDMRLAIAQGVDLMDCVTPTRLARTGTVYTDGGNAKLSLMRSDVVGSTEPIDSTCSCMVCQHYTRGYLAHLFRAKEMLGAILASYHNLHTLLRIVEEERENI
jgi:queuine tRNA-ribosyltransferase